MAYEGMRAISGPFLGHAWRERNSCGIVAGTGELAGYLLRLVSGRLAERTRAYWPITLRGLCDPDGGGAGSWRLRESWRVAAVLIVLERTGKAMRNPAGNTMMSRAGEHIGQGWAFGLHEALDQTGALAGPLIAALVLRLHHAYRDAFPLARHARNAHLVQPVLTLRLRFAFAGAYRAAPRRSARDTTLSRAFWLYSRRQRWSAFGFADFPLIAFHFGKAHVVPQALGPALLCQRDGRGGRGLTCFRTLVRRARTFGS